MRDRPLARREAAARLGFGGAGVSNIGAAIDDDRALAAVARAWENGIRHFDTAPHYGLGLSERRLGEALAGYPRSSWTVSTKAGRLLVPREPALERDDDLFDVPGTHRRVWDLTRDGILRSLEQSLERLRTDRVDVLLLHDPDRAPDPAEAEAAAQVLLDLRAEGVVREVGVGSNDSGTVARLLRGYDLGTAMLAGRYTLLRDEGVADVVDAAAGRRLMLAGVFNSGLLATADPQGTGTFDYAAVPEQVLGRARELAALAVRHGATLPQLAVQHVLRHPAEPLVVLGMSSPDEVEQDLDAATAPVPQALWDEVDRLRASWGLSSAIRAARASQPS